MSQAADPDMYEGLAAMSELLASHKRPHMASAPAPPPSAAALPAADKTSLEHRTSSKALTPEATPPMPPAPLSRNSFSLLLVIKVLCEDKLLAAIQR